MPEDRDHRAGLEPKLPVVRAAMAEGAISGEHVRRIDKVLGKVPEHAVEQVERELVELAYQFNPTELAKLGTHLINTLDPDGPEPADASVVEGQNELDLRQHEDGSLTGRFHLGVESAALVMSLLSPLTTPRPDDDRTLIERQGDALAEIITFAADSGKAPIEGGERPHIAVTVSLEALQTGIGTATLDDGRTLDSGADPAAGVRCRNHSDRAGQQVPATRHRRVEAAGQQTATPGVGDPRQGMRRTRMCANTAPMSRPSRATLGGRWADNLGEHGAGVPLPSPADPPRRVASAYARRATGVHPTSVAAPRRLTAAAVRLPPSGGGKPLQTHATEPPQRLRTVTQSRIG